MLVRYFCNVLIWIFSKNKTTVFRNIIQKNIVLSEAPFKVWKHFFLINHKLNSLNMTELQEKLQIGPRSGVHYPVIVNYCGNCTMPIEVSFVSIFKIRLFLLLLIYTLICIIITFSVLWILSRVWKVQEMAWKESSRRVWEAGS